MLSKRFENIPSKKELTTSEKIMGVNPKVTFPRKNKKNKK